MSIKIKELPELERPYEKLEMYGEKALSNAELLAIIIKTGTKDETAVGVAQRLLKMNNTTEEDLNYLQGLSIEELIQVKGIGKVKAIQLKAVGEIAIRMFKHENYKKTKITTPSDIAKIVMSEMKYQKKEILKVVMLNSSNEVLKIKDVALGSTGFVSAPIKDVLTEPIKIGAPKIILVHNHPSGNANPSREDKVYTENLYEDAKKMGIELIDHIVIGNMQYTSIFTEFITEEEKNRKKLKKEGKSK